MFFMLIKKINKYTYALIQFASIVSKEFKCPNSALDQRLQHNLTSSFKNATPGKTSACSSPYPRAYLRLETTRRKQLSKVSSCIQQDGWMVDGWPNRNSAIKVPMCTLHSPTYAHPRQSYALCTLRATTWNQVGLTLLSLRLTAVVLVLLPFLVVLFRFGHTQTTR